jgi:hypothetical protein
LLAVAGSSSQLSFVEKLKLPASTVKNQVYNMELEKSLICAKLDHLLLY